MKRHFGFLVGGLALALALTAAGCGLYAAPGAGADADADADAGWDGDGDANGDGLVVQTDRGTVRGALEGSARAWLGIPYASPPVGALRWRPPQPAAAWVGERDARVAGSRCPQEDATGTLVGDEDCLFLNVWTPAAATAAATAPTPLPVVVFVHGGNWVRGAGTLPLYDGARLAERGGVMVVTINYRLGALGFLAHESLLAEDPLHTTGNYGLLDQLAALAWVQQNARAFGGDPTRVLLWGQSAGAWSTLMHMASPLGRDLFTRALSESGGTYARPLATAEAAGASYASQLGCDGAQALACLRALPTATLATTLPDGPIWDPAIDGTVLTEPVATTFAKGTQAAVPLVVGTTLQEYRAGGLTPNPPVDSVTTEGDYAAAVAQKFGAASQADILARYPSATYASPRMAYVAVLDDWGMLCPTRRIARRIAVSQNAPVWRYVFAHTVSTGPLHAHGPAHGVDLAFWFGSFGALAGLAPTEAERQLSGAMIDYLARFAATGDPNGESGPDGLTWPRLDASGDALLRLDDAVMPATGLHEAACDFWDARAGG